MDKPDARDGAIATVTGSSRSRAIQLRAGDARLAIDVDRGGRLGSWSIDGRELLVGPPSDEDRSIGWGCFLMAPWAGRLADGRFRAEDGREIQLPRSHGRHAIHGLLWDRPWTVESASVDEATLVCALPPDQWPPGGVARHEIRLLPDGLAMGATLVASRMGEAGMAGAIGWHPWFRRAGTASLRVESNAVVETRELLPTGGVVPVAGKTDLRNGPDLGRRRLDHAYVEADSPAVLRLDDVELTISFEPSPATVVVYTPASSVCVEPQTAWPNAAALGGTGPRPDREARARAGLRILAPGETMTASMTIEARFLAPREGRAGSERAVRERAAPERAGL